MRLLAVTLGLLSALCALAFPFLPVVQDTAEIVWPNGTDTGAVNAPLTGYWAQDMHVELPCSTVHSTDKRTQGPALLYATIPDARSENGAGVQLRIDNGLLDASMRGQQIARQPLPTENCDVQLDSDATRSSTRAATSGRGSSASTRRSAAAKIRQPGSRSRSSPTRATSRRRRAGRSPSGYWRCSRSSAA